jgi:hypothetical protein
MVSERRRMTAHPSADSGGVDTARRPSGEMATSFFATYDQSTTQRTLIAKSPGGFVKR